MRRCIDLTLIWGAAVCLGSLWLWMMGDAALLDFHTTHWLILIPGPALITLAIYFRFTERPCPFGSGSTGRNDGVDGQTSQLS
jgi:hypothetical protein